MKDNFQPVLEVPYKELGRFICKHQPTLAYKIIRIIHNAVPAYKDLDLIPGLFDTFCSFKNLQPADVVGIGKPRNIIVVRYTFIAVAIKLYNPEILSGVSSSQFLKRKLREQLAKTLKCNPQWISQKIPEITLHLEIYADFIEDVFLCVQHLKNNRSDKVIE